MKTYQIPLAVPMKMGFNEPDKYFIERANGWEWTCDSVTMREWVQKGHNPDHYSPPGFHMLTVESETAKNAYHIAQNKLSEITEISRRR